ncbi:MAG: hypothetical protein ACFFAO_14400 [Candidatus Hermodarchaeota archaeon]
MPSNPSESTGLPRITVSLDLFDETVISMMANKRNKSKSETIRTIVNQWIMSNSNILKEQYGIETEEVSREIEIKDKNKFLDDKIKKLISYSSKIKTSIDAQLLANTLDISQRMLMQIIFEHADKLKEKGINLIIEGNLIVKE